MVAYGRDIWGGLSRVGIVLCIVGRRRAIGVLVVDTLWEVGVRVLGVRTVGSYVVGWLMHG